MNQIPTNKPQNSILYLLYLKTIGAIVPIITIMTTTMGIVINASPKKKQNPLMASLLQIVVHSMRVFA